MTVKELKEKLETYPEDSIIMYRHNNHGRIDIDEIKCTEENLSSGKKIHCLTFEASFEED